MHWAEVNAILGRVVVAFDDGRVDVGDLIITALDRAKVPRFQGVVPRRAGADHAVADRAVVGDPWHHSTIDVAYREFRDEVLRRIESPR